jgi:hypothetical protein
MRKLIATIIRFADTSKNPILIPKSLEQDYLKATDQIIDLIYGKIEKVENPYGWACKMMKRDIDGAHGRGFEDCRQKILSLLRPEK